MSTRREQMIDLMQVKRLAKTTQKSYLYSVDRYEKHYATNLEYLKRDDLQRYIVYLARDRNLSSNSCRLHLQGIRFFYRHVLRRPLESVDVLAPSCERRIPDLLTREEALRIVNSAANLRNETQLKLCYSCGLRISEVIHLRVKDIDGERHLLKIVQGKGKKDRFVPMSEAMLHLLRRYWCQYHPRDLLFFASPYLDREVTPTSITKALRIIKQSLSITKRGSSHSLRHAYATHQLEAGLPLHLLQRWLGHSDIRTTMRYVHWVPGYQNGQGQFRDLLGGYHESH